MRLTTNNNIKTKRNYNLYAFSGSPKKLEGEKEAGGVCFFLNWVNMSYAQCEIHKIYVFAPWLTPDKLTLTMPITHDPEKVGQKTDAFDPRAVENMMKCYLVNMDCGLGISNGKTRQAMI